MPSQFKGQPAAQPNTEPRLYVSDYVRLVPAEYADNPLAAYGAVVTPGTTVLPSGQVISTPSTPWWAILALTAPAVAYLAYRARRR